MDIKVLGPGCARCKQLEQQVYNVLAEMDVAANVEKVEDIQKIISYRVMSTPALVVNGKVKVAGSVPPPDRIRKLIEEEL
ncbi:MAG: thioredoxin family protein [Syntrophomonadaceae bacterium]|nr:thioredoxin family protein [Syntrophomonadaceae bacterium]